MKNCYLQHKLFNGRKVLSEKFSNILHTVFYPETTPVLNKIKY